MNRSPKTLGWILTASLTLNLFLAGFVVARLTGPTHSPLPSAQRAKRMNGHQDEQMLPLRRLMRKRRGELMPARAEVRAARNEVRAALLQEPFSEPALTRALGLLRRATGHAQESLHTVLIEAASDLPLDERRTLSESRGLFHRGTPRRHGRRPRHGATDDGGKRSTGVRIHARGHQDEPETSPSPGSPRELPAAH